MVEEIIDKYKLHVKANYTVRKLKDNLAMYVLLNTFSEWFMQSSRNRDTSVEPVDFFVASTSQTGTGFFLRI